MAENDALPERVWIAPHEAEWRTTQFPDGDGIAYRRADLAAPDAPVGWVSCLVDPNESYMVNLCFETPEHAERFVKEFTAISDAVRQARRETCVWALDDVTDGCLWETDCGQAFQFNDGGPGDNHFKFCYCCGKPLEVLRRTESDEVEIAEGEKGE